MRTPRSCVAEPSFSNFYFLSLPSKVEMNCSSRESEPELVKLQKPEAGACQYELAPQHLSRSSSSLDQNPRKINKPPPNLLSQAVLRIILKRIRIQDRKNFLWIRIQAKTIRIRIQAMQDSVLGKSSKFYKNAHLPCTVCYITYGNYMYQFSVSNQLNNCFRWFLLDQDPA